MNLISFFASVFGRRFTHFIGLFSRNLTDLTWDSKFVWLKFRKNFLEHSFTRLHSPRITKVRHSLISLSISFLNPKSLGFIFSTRNSLTCHLHIFSRPQVIENCRQYLLLRTDVLQKTVVGCPWHFKDGSFKMNIIHCAHRERASLSSSISFHKNSWIHLNFIELIKYYDHGLSSCRTATTIYWF